MSKLVIFSQDWADEFQAEGFCVFSEEEWAEYKTYASTADRFYFYFGTNEGWDSDIFTPQEILDGIEVHDITEEQEATFKKIFRGRYFGHFPDKESFLQPGEEC